MKMSAPLARALTNRASPCHAVPGPGLDPRLAVGAA